MNKSIHIIVELSAKEGKLEEMKQIFEELARETRNEDGAIDYIFIEDQNKPNTLLSIEKWESEDAEAKHWETPHLKEALKKAEEVLAGKPIIHKGLQVV
ncbi:MAG: putative quinol monooxygenase [Bacteroidota bacterium]